MGRSSSSVRSARAGFVEARRTGGGAVWLRRGVQELMIGTMQQVPDYLAARPLREADDTAE